MNNFPNPFPDSDADRQIIWEILVNRDIAAFVAKDWSQVVSDFDEHNFQGVDACGSDNPDDWRIKYSSLSVYRDEWLRQSEETANTDYAEDLTGAIHRATTLRDIEIAGDIAIAHKKFDGEIRRTDGGRDRLKWQTIYYLRRSSGQWRITGFTGYLPNPMGSGGPPRTAKTLPVSAGQHVTAGPYSPVLEISADRIVVISGQAAIATDGSIIGQTIEEQAKATLENCQHQLATAACSLADVFKVNVYMTDLDLWGRFNAVYVDFMPEPRPVRTAIGSKLLPELIVEIEMWAVKK